MRLCLLAVLLLPGTVLGTERECGNKIAKYAAPLTRIAVSMGQDGSLIVAADSKGNLFRAFDSAKRIGVALEPQGFLVALGNAKPGKSIASLATVYAGEQGGAIPGFIATIQGDAFYLIDPMLREYKLWEPVEGETVESVALALVTKNNQPDRIRAFVGTSWRIVQLDIPADLESDFDAVTQQTVRWEGTRHLYTLGADRFIFSRLIDTEDYEICEWFKGDLRVRGQVQMDLRTLGAYTAGSHLTIQAHGFADRPEPESESEPGSESESQADSDSESKSPRRATLLTWQTQAPVFVERDFGDYRVAPIGYAVSRARSISLTRPGAHQITNLFPSPHPRNAFRMTSELVLSDGEIQAILPHGMLQPAWTVLNNDPDSDLVEQTISDHLSDKIPAAWGQEQKWIASELNRKRNISLPRANVLASSWLLKERLDRYLHFPQAKIDRSLATLGLHTAKEQLLLLFLAPEDARDRILRMRAVYLYRKDFPLILPHWSDLLQKKFKGRPAYELPRVSDALAKHLGMQKQYVLKRFQEIGSRMAEDDPDVDLGEVAERVLETHHPLWMLKSVLELEDAVDSKAREREGESE